MSEPNLKRTKSSHATSTHGKTQSLERGLGNRPHPISTLVPELLVEIFSHCRPQFPTLTWRVREWLSILRVCRRWYEIVLHAPQLWNEISANNNTSLRTMLSRSGAMPLYIAMWGSITVDTLRLLLAQISRIRILDMTDIEPSYVGNIREALNSNGVTTMKELRISLSFSSNEHRDTAVRDLLPTKDLKLDTLSCSGFVIQNVTSIYPGCASIKDLRLSQCSPRLGPKTLIADVLSALQAMPLLETLVLDQAFQQGSDVSPVSQVSLPKLQSLEIRDSGVHTKKVVTSLDIPATASVLFMPLLARRYHHIADDIATRLGLRPSDSQTLSIVLDCMDNTVLRVWINNPPSPETDISWRRQDPPRFTLISPKQDRDSTYTSYFLSFVSELSPDSVESVSIHGRLEYLKGHREGWLTFVSHMRRLRQLSVGPTSEDYVLAILQNDKKDRSGSDSRRRSTKACPALRDLELVGSRLDLLARDPDKELKKMPTLMQYVMKVLRIRHEAHGGIRSLTFSKCLTDKYDMTQLQSEKYIDEVTVRTDDVHAVYMEVQEYTRLPIHFE